MPIARYGTSIFCKIPFECLRRLEGFFLNDDAAKETARAVNKVDMLQIIVKLAMVLGCRVLEESRKTETVTDFIETNLISSVKKV